MRLTAGGARQVIEALHPGTIKLSQVKTKARSEYDYICNFKLLQKAFDKLRISKHIEVDRMIKGKPLDNIEFCQWFKRYSDTVTGGGDAAGSEAVKAQVAAGAGPARPALRKAGRAATGDARKGTGGATASSAPRAAGGSRAAPAGGAKALAPASAQQAKELQALQEHATELKMQADMLEKERDFYYAKLRDVEILAQSECVAGTPLVGALEKVLYADGEESLLDKAIEGLEAAVKLVKAAASAGAGAGEAAPEQPQQQDNTAPPKSPALTPSKLANITPLRAATKATPQATPSSVKASPMAVDE